MVWIPSSTSQTVEPLTAAIRVVCTLILLAYETSFLCSTCSISLPQRDGVISLLPSSKCYIQVKGQWILGAPPISFVNWTVRRRLSGSTASSPPDSFFVPRHMLPMNTALPPNMRSSFVAFSNFGTRNIPLDTNSHLIAPYLFLFFSSLSRSPRHLFPPSCSPVLR